MIFRPMAPGATATGNADESRERGQYNCPIKYIHWLILSEFGASSYEARKFG